MSSIISVDFEALIDDIRNVFVQRFIDAPTRLSLALTSKSMFRLASPYLRSYEEYDFLTDCCKFGYYSLARFAFGKYPPADTSTIDAAFEANHPEMVEWLYPSLIGYLMKSDQNRFIGYCIEHDCTQTLETLLALTKPDEYSLSSFRRFADEIHASPAVRRLLGSETTFYSDEKGLDDNSLRKLAKLGRLDLIKSFGPLSQNIAIVLVAASLTCENADLLDYGLEQKGMLPKYTNSSIDFLISLHKSKKPLYSGMEGFFHRFAEPFKRRPRLDVLKYLVNNHLLPQNFRYKELFFIDLRYSSRLENKYAFIKPRDHKETFSCVKYLFEQSLLSWSLADLWTAPSFANLEQLKWMIKSATDYNESIDFKGVISLKSAVYISSRIDSEVFSFFFDSKSFDSECLFDLCFLDNNVELLRIVYKKLGFLELHAILNCRSSKNELLQKISKHYLRLFERKPISSVDFPIISKFRPRLGNLIDLIRLIIIEFEMPFNPNARQELRKIPNKVFRSRLSSLDLDYWDRISKLDS